MTRRIVIILMMTAVVLFSQNKSILYAQSNDDSYRNLLKQAERYVNTGDKEKAYYYLTRCFGLVISDKSTKIKVEDVEKIIGKIGLKSTSFISGKYSSEFLDWFHLAAYYMWATPETYTSESDFSSVITLSHNDKYYVGIVAHPVIESWSIVGAENGKIKNSYVHLIDYKNPPKIIVGDIKTNEIITEYKLNSDNKRLYYQYFWRPILKDFNNDGNTEIILRYNIARADGFYQKCDIYSISGKNIKLIDSIIGDPEGFAYYISGDEFQSGRALPSSSEIGHLFYDLYEIKKYRFVNNKFQVTETEKPVQNILWTDKFKKYFYEKSGEMH